MLKWYVVILQLFFMLQASCLSQWDDSMLLNQSSQINYTGIYKEVALRSQRDIGMNVPIDQQTNLGVSLSELLFSPLGYTEDSMNQVEQLLALGVRNLMLDVYWNEMLQRWQLCPGPIPTNATNMYSLNQFPNVTVNWAGSHYVCQWNTTISSLVNVINSYIKSTDTNMNADLIHILLNLHSIKEPYTNSSSNFASAYNSTLLANLYPATLSSAFENLNSLFTPVDEDKTMLNGFYGQLSTPFPTLKNFLLVEYKRVLVSVSSSDITPNKRQSYEYSSADNSTIFKDKILNINKASNSTLLNICNSLNNLSQSELTDWALTSNFKFVIDDEETPFQENSLRAFSRCGYSPILNSSNYVIAGNNVEVFQNSSNGTNVLSSMISVMNSLSLWSWDVGQPLIPTNTSDQTSDDESNNSHVSSSTYMENNSSYTSTSISSNNNNNNNNDDDDDDDDPVQIAYKCVTLQKKGWILSNCYEEEYYGCQNQSQPLHWHIPNEKRNYFDAANNNSCPQGFEFSTPHSAVENIALVTEMKRSNKDYPVWIDVNDITVPLCFVSGGPLASCPYQRTVNSLTLVKMIAPNIVVAAVILLLIFLEKFVRKTPIQHNRKRHWKRAVVDYMEKYDYEGVPS